MKFTFLTIASLLCTLLANTVSAQWTSFNSPQDPFAPNTRVPHIAADYDDKQVYAFSHDTSYHFFRYHESRGWNAYPEHDEMLDSFNAIYDTKARNGKLWALTSRGLLTYDNNTFNLVKYPAGYQPGTNGLVVTYDGSVWFAGGPGGHGITRFTAPNSWYNINAQTHPAFVQDNGITDLKLNEWDSILWIGTNCFSQNSGVSSYNIKTNQLVKHPNSPKYGCIHAVEPGNGKTFVGTANFSSLRVMDGAGNYVQSLDYPAIPWITEMRIDPSDSNRVWALTELGLVQFIDTLHYTVFDTTNSPLRGSVEELSIKQNNNDSMEVWVGTSKGIFRYTYRNGQSTGLKEYAEQSTFTLYPNPASQQITISHANRLISSVRIVDITGRVVMSTATNHEKQVTVFTGNLPAGIYTVLVDYKNNVSAQKLVLTR
jgi:hypothetical protein